MTREDIYVLLEYFTESEIDFFRMKYLAGFIPCASYYEYPPIPYNAKIEYETDDVDKMISYMTSGCNGYFRFYFRNPNEGDIRMGMIFFNDDNTLALGLGVNTEVSEVYRNQLRGDFGSDLIMSCYNDDFPPSNSKEFKEIIRK